MPIQLQLSLKTETFSYARHKSTSGNIVAVKYNIKLFLTLKINKNREGHVAKVTGVYIRPLRCFAELASNDGEESRSFLLLAYFEF